MKWTGQYQNGLLTRKIWHQGDSNENSACWCKTCDGLDEEPHFPGWEANCDKKGGTTTFPHPHFSCWIWASDDFFSRDIWPKGSGKEYKVTATSSSAYDSFTLDFTLHLLRREPIPFPPPHLVVMGTALVRVFHIFFFPAVGSRVHPSILHAM